MHQIRFWPELRPQTPLGELAARRFPGLLSWIFRTLLLRGGKAEKGAEGRMEGEGGEEGREGNEEEGERKERGERPSCGFVSP